MTFHTTRWTVVRSVNAASADERRAALETLCRQYWPPIYAFLRRSGKSATESEDLTQAFFARLLEQESLGTPTPERGRFRAYLLGALRHFLSNERDRERAWKRGSGRVPLSLDGTTPEELESRWTLEPADGTTPEREFELAWARAVLERALARLGEEQERAGKTALWNALRPKLALEEESVSNPELASALGLSETALRVALHRLRRRFAELVRDEVRETVGPGEIEDELAELRRALA